MIPPSQTAQGFVIFHLFGCYFFLWSANMGIHMQTTMISGRAICKGRIFHWVDCQRLKKSRWKERGFAQEKEANETREGRQLSCVEFETGRVFRVNSSGNHHPIRTTIVSSWPDVTMTSSARPTFHAGEQSLYLPIPLLLSIIWYDGW